MINLENMKERYEYLYGNQGVDESVLKKIEKRLNIKLPKDFCQISSFYSGGLLGGISIFSIDYGEISPNITEETLRLRNAIKLPPQFIFLAEPPESIIVLDTKDSPSVIWCDTVEVGKLQDKLFLNSSNVWNSYMDFFEYLLCEEDDEME